MFGLTTGSRTVDTPGLSANLSMIIRRSGNNRPQCLSLPASRCTFRLGLALGAALLVLPAAAQERPRDARPIPPLVLPLINDAPAARDVSTRQHVDRRWDPDSHVDRARYRIASTLGAAVDTAVAARVGAAVESTINAVPIEGRAPSDLALDAAAYLDVARARYGLAAVSSDLQLVGVRRSDYSAHVTWQQQVGGVPVQGRFVRMSLNRRGEPTFVVNGVDVDIEQRLRAAGLSPDRLVANVSAAAAAASAKALFGDSESSTSSNATLVVLPDAEARLAWRVTLQADAYPGDWEVMIDGMSGLPIRARDMALRRRPVESAVQPPAVVAPPRPWTSMAPMRTDGAVVRADGAGRAFEPDPLTSSGADYGSPFVDNDDGDVSAINAELVDVVLRDITLGVDSKYRLEGPYARVIGGGALNYSPPAEALPTGFTYTRASDFFEAVNSYYHVDQSQRYVQSLGYADVQVGGVSINPQAFASDNSLYLPSINQLSFGTGGVDDGEDAGVVWHEYGHALLNDVAPGLIDSGEGQALHEGWADYWAGSYLRGLVEAGKSLRFDWESVFRWDSGDGAIWEGRMIGVPGVYPEDTTCDTMGGNSGRCDFYADGLLWASTLMEIYDELGKEVTDRLNLQSHQYIIAPATFRDAAEALLQADQDLFAGAYASVLTSRLVSRGYLEQNSLAPLVEHTQLADTEAVGGTVSMEVTASSPTASIDSVRVVYQFEGEFDRSIHLTHSSGSQFSSPFNLPFEAGVVEYQVEVYDDEGRVSVLPQNAPVDRFSFYVGPDVIAPVIVHDPLMTVSTIAWPPTVVAGVTDNLGVMSVTGSWLLRDADGTQRDSGSFGLAPSGLPNKYQGSIQADRSDVSDGWTIEYSLVATDAAQSANTTRHPATGQHTATVRSTGTLFSLDFEAGSTGVVATGEWTLGPPVGVLSVAHSGDNVWATRLGSPYASTPQLSTLGLQSFDLTGTNADLVFWHWHDFEHSGVVHPGADNSAASLWDGGNVKISINGGLWNVAIPDGGYTGAVATSGGNPLAGQQAFGGYSFGWRREVITLPSAADVRIRFDFGTDSSNDETSIAFAGWYLDDISVTTELPVDVTAPVVESGPPARIVATASGAATSLAIRLTDDVGVGAVELVPEPGSEVEIPVQRFAMSSTDIDVFGLDVALPEVAAGERLSYRIRASDFSGNERLIPDATQPPFVVDYRTIFGSDALAGAVASGAWIRFGSTWRVDSDDALSQQRLRSGLILSPLTIPDNAEDVRLLMTHSFDLDGMSGGNVHVSDDDGTTWQLLVPSGGYTGVWASASSHPLAGQQIFQGARSSAVDTFDVTAYSGKSVRIRLDGGYAEGASAGSFWSVTALSLQAVSSDDDVNFPRSLRLDANFPDPFATTTTLTYTIPEEDLVRVSVFDVMGRRVRVLLFQTQQAGAHTLQLQADGLADGLYFVQLEAGGRRSVERVVVMR